MKSGVIEEANRRYKFDEKWDWKLIFARLLVAFLESEGATFDQFDLIVSSPTFIDFAGAGGARTRDHIREVVSEAAVEPWSFDEADPAIVKGDRCRT